MLIDTKISSKEANWFNGLDSERTHVYNLVSQNTGIEIYNLVDNLVLSRIFIPVYEPIRESSRENFKQAIARTRF